MRTTLRFSQEGTRFFTLFMAFLALIWQTHPLSAAHMTVDSFAPFPHIKFFERFGVSQSEDSFHFEQMLSVISTANQKSPFHFQSKLANKTCAPIKNTKWYLAFCGHTIIFIIVPCAERGRIIDFCAAAFLWGNSRV